MSICADITRVTAGREAGIAFLRRAGTAQGKTKGKTIVLLHGIGSNGGSFTPLIDALPEAFDVIAWHAPGYGGSRSLVSSFPQPQDYAEALLSFIDVLGLERITLLGHSLGCLFAGSFAARHAERVGALALLSPALGYRVKAGETMPETVQGRIDELRALGPRDFAAKRAARLVYQPDGKPAVLAAVREAMAAVDPVGYMQAARALGAGDLMADAPALSMATLVAVGAQDVVTPPANARKLYDALPRPAGYHEIPDAGHALPQENPAAVARLLVNLIEASDA
ncbi:MAG: alpha/beta hydrolase [Proteobacteria bacterium]|nr:alpha/beta hydrolase [Pseudomonadota bacterium]